MPLLHAFDFLTSPPESLPAVVIVRGNDSTLRGWVISKLNQDTDVSVLDGETALWTEIHDELLTASLFSAGERQTVVVRNGDKLFKEKRGDDESDKKKRSGDKSGKKNGSSDKSDKKSRSGDNLDKENRQRIEQYVVSPSDASRLVLELEQLPTNTRLYKAAEKTQLLVECSSPETGSGRTPRPDASRISKFLVRYIAPRYQTKLTDGAAKTLIALVGGNIGMLDCEIAKLAVHLEIDQTITETLVREVVAGWIGKTMWEINDAAAGGNAAEALRHLDKLLCGGHSPLALLPQLSWALRRLGMATAVVDETEARGRRASAEEGLRGSGFRGSPNDLKKADTQMKQLGRERARQLLPWLLEADLKLKGSHSAAPRDRWVLEELICKLAKR